MKVEFFFDYGSPFSYLADTQLAGLRERTGSEVVYRPMLLGGVFKATGNRSPAEEPIAPKRANGGRDMARWVEHYGVRFGGNPHFPINTLRLMRTCVGAQHRGEFETFHRAVYPAFWAEGLNLGDDAVVKQVLESAGLDASALLATADDPDIKAELRTNTDEAVERGAFGAPTFFVGDELYFGNDRLLFVEKALQQGEK